MFKKLKENKKGFTLVELIVVLVILAILAALLVPALTGYIDKAKKKSIIAETRQCVMAAQTLVDEKYGAKLEGTAVTVEKNNSDVTYDDIKTLAEVKGDITAVTLTTTKDGATTTEDGSAVNAIKTLTYEKSGYTCIYRPNPDKGTTNSDGDYNVEKATATE